jgi:hypothetical protein
LTSAPIHATGLSAWEKQQFFEEGFKRFFEHIACRMYQLQWREDFAVRLGLV